MSQPSHISARAATGEFLYKIFSSWNLGLAGLFSPTPDPFDFFRLLSYADTAKISTS